MTKLADAADVSVSTIKRMETIEPRPISMNAYATVQRALEAAGISFLFDSGRAEGLWFRHG